jgi:hypothetical protein
MRAALAALPAVALVMGLLAQERGQPPGAAPTLAQDWVLSTPEPLPSRNVTRIESQATAACYECHREVTDEWAGTLHAAAWLDDLYQAELRKVRKPLACHGCHVPASLFTTGLDAQPAPRTTDLHFGVSCEACHQTSDGEILGPRGTATPAHRTRAHAAFSAPGSDQLCATCHSVTIGPVTGIAKDFALSGQSAKGQSCVGCHMAPVERRWANAPGGEPDPQVPPRLGRSHALQTPRDPAFLRRAFEFRVHGENARTRLSIANMAGHRVGGLAGRRIEFEVTLLSAQGEKVDVAKQVVDAKAFLPVGGTLEVALEGRGARVLVVGTLFGPHAGLEPERGAEFYRESLGCP